MARAISEHRAYLDQTGRLEIFRRERARAEMETLLRESLFADWSRSHAVEEFEAALERVLARQMAPRKAVEMLLAGPIA